MKNRPLGQLLLMGLPGAHIDENLLSFIRRVQPGGFILFGRNIQNPKQLRDLIDTLRKESRIEPIITIDQEGGRVSRLKLLGHEPPNARQLRQSGQEELITRHGIITGKLLRLFGFNLDLCPVLDIAFDEDADNSLRGRCYGKSADEVIKLAGLFNQALQSTGILSCGKHFPGYSWAPNDPHYDLSALPRSRSELEANELKVFRHFATPRKSTSEQLVPDNVVDSMMIGHISYSQLDDSPFPASLSPTIVTQLLREEMNFQGLVMTDDLDMGAIVHHYSFPEMLRLGLAAGNDLLMICHRSELGEEALEHLATFPEEQLDRALQNIARFKERMAPPDPFSLEAFHALDEEVWQLRVETLGEEEAKKRSPEDGKRSPVEVY